MDIAEDPLVRNQRIVLSALGISLVGLAFLVRVELYSASFYSLLGGTLLSLVMVGVFGIWLLKTKSPIEITYSAKATHFLQAAVQLSILAELSRFYGGVRQQVPLIVYQACFAFIIQILLSTFFRRKCEFSFAVLPIIASINLLMWFKPEVYGFQLALVGLAVGGKFFILGRNNRHIFNPSGLALAVATYVLIALKASHKWLELDFIYAYHQFAPNTMLIHVFAVSCIMLYLADRCLVTVGGLGVMLFAYFGCISLFGRPAMPFVVHPSVLIGLTLFITDPVTSPSNAASQLLYGAAYGCSILLGEFLANKCQFPAAFNKILFLPLLNLGVPYFERIDARRRLSAVLASSGRIIPFIAYALLFLPLVPFRQFRGDSLLSVPVDHAADKFLDQYVDLKTRIDDPNLLFMQLCAKIHVPCGWEVARGSKEGVYRSPASIRSDAPRHVRARDILDGIEKDSLNYQLVRSREVLMLVPKTSMGWEPNDTSVLDERLKDSLEIHALRIEDAMAALFEHAGIKASPAGLSSGGREEPGPRLSVICENDTVRQCLNDMARADGHVTWIFGPRKDIGYLYSVSRWTEQ